MARSLLRALYSQSSVYKFVYSKATREIISENKSKFKITRTVKNEISKSDIIIDTRDSTDSDERIEVNLKGSKKSKKGKSR